jgi:phage baseplate assembly protein W
MDISSKLFVDVYNVEELKNSIINIILLQKGEVPGNPNFGSTVNSSIFDMQDGFALINLEDKIRDAINTQDDRIVLEEVVIEHIPEYNKTVAKIKFTSDLTNITTPLNITIG